MHVGGIKPRVGAASGALRSRAGDPAAAFGNRVSGVSANRAAMQPTCITG
jgi:hypothetical protein